MSSIFWKELKSFFSTVTAYVVLSVFLVLTSLFLWVFKDTSVLESEYASLSGFFTLAPIVFLFLIPAVTMKSFADEIQRGTLEFLFTKPISSAQLLLGKFLANWLLIILALIPTLVYVFSVHQLGSPVGNIDLGEVGGSYIGLIFQAGIFVAIGLFCSSLTSNQIVAFLMAAFLCFIMQWSFDYLSALPAFFGKTDDIIQKMGIEYHYREISQGKLTIKDIVYFVSIIGMFLWFTFISLERKKS